MAGYVCFVILQIPAAVAQNLQTIMIFRFLGGVAASGPSAIVGGYLADSFPPVERGVAVAIFTATTLIGTLVGPIIGGFIVQSYLGWRWTAWISLTLAAVCGIIGFIVSPETYLPVLLKRKARRLRFETKNWALHPKLEETSVDIRGFTVKYLSRPFLMLCLEPVLQLMKIYISFVYGILLLTFVAFPVSYIEERGYSSGVGALPFIAVLVGVVLGSTYVTHYVLTTVKWKYEERGGINPEDSGRSNNIHRILESIDQRMNRMGAGRFLSVALVDTRQDPFGHLRDGVRKSWPKGSETNADTAAQLTEV